MPSSELSEEYVSYDWRNLSKPKNGWCVIYIGLFLPFVWFRFLLRKLVCTRSIVRLCQFCLLCKPRVKNLISLLQCVSFVLEGNLLNLKWKMLITLLQWREAWQSLAIATCIFIDVTSIGIWDDCEYSKNISLNS